ncbi:uncharacterized protein LOC141886399 [Acropora palmata]|uniref:uncharacterized protein LOC141886399 n=1 Tax=Acropora palmata TaxID=6131 RepID=UPI003DA0509B
MVVLTYQGAPHGGGGGKGDSKAIDEEGKQYSGDKGKNDGGGLDAYKTKRREQSTINDYLGAQISEPMDDDLSHRIHELQTEGQEEPDKVDLFEGTVTSEGFHLDLNAGAIHLTFPPGTVDDPTDIMVYKWKYGARLPHLMEHEALVNMERNEWEEIGGCKDIRQVLDIDDYPCPNKVPYFFPVLRAGITKCSTYAVVSRLKLSPRYTITVSGGTFVHPDYPQVTLTVPQKAVKTETRLPLELKVQEVPQEEFHGHDLFCGPILRILCPSRDTFLEPVTIQLPVSLGNKLVHLPQPSECRVRIFFLSPEREIKEWVEISDKLENPASYDGKLVKFKVERFSGYMCLLDRAIGGSVLPFWYLAHLSSIIWNQPLVATLFAYFDPKERLGSRNILFLICCPAHQSKDVKQELEKKGLTPCEATSRRDMIPGRDRAFVFVSGGISFASLEDMEGFYLRFNGNEPHKAQLQVRLISDKAYCKVDFRDTPDTTECTNLLSTLNLRFSGGRQTSGRKLKVTLLSTELGSTTGGLSTMNRELAIRLAKHSNVEVYMYLPWFSDEDERAAAHCNISLLKAKKRHGYDDPVDWLASIPRDHQMDVVIGHGIHLGRQVPHIRESHPECKWVQVVHANPEERGMFMTYAGSTVKGEKEYEAELALCKEADQVVVIGPKLADTYSRSCGKEKVFVLIPGIFAEFSDIKQDTGEREEFRVLILGRGDNEDFQVKGYDIAAGAVARLKNEDSPFKLVFVGAPNGKEEQAKDMFLNKGISPIHFIVRSAKERKQLAEQFCEADLVIMPSRTEVFGLAALEALSAGLPVLVSGNSGFGLALNEVPFGKLVVLNSEDAKEWAKAIKAVRRKRREVRLEEAIELREKYAKKYKWEGQCRSLLEKMHEIVKR